MFFKHFANKNQIPGLSINRTLVENGLIILTLMKTILTIMIVLILFMLDSLFGVTDINNEKYAKQMGKELMPVVGNPSK